MTIATITLIVMKIKKELLESLLEATKRFHPQEFLAFMSCTNSETIDEFVAVPFIAGEEHAIFSIHEMPIDQKIKGSFHSHPSPDNNPSDADLEVFAKTGKIHAIAAYPYRLQDVAFFNQKGQRIQIELV